MRYIILDFIIFLYEKLPIIFIRFIVLKFIVCVHSSKYLLDYIVRLLLNVLYKAFFTIAALIIANHVSEHISLSCFISKSLFCLYICIS